MSLVALRGAELRVEDRGRGAPVVLLHGLGGSGNDWTPVAEVLAAHHRVIVPDLRGSGASRDLERPHGPFTVAQLAGDIATLLGRMGASPAHVVGWSLGGMVALQLAVESPAQIRSLVLVNTGPDWTPRSRAQRLAFGVRGLATALMPPALLGRPLARRLFPLREQAALRARYVERMRLNDRRAYAALLEAIMTWSIADRLPSISARTLVVSSELDYVTPAATEAWVRRLSDARLIIARGARHALPLESPAWLAEQIREHVDDSEPPRQRPANGP